MGGDGLGDGIVVGGDDEGSGLRRLLKGGHPEVVVRFVDGAAQGNAGALEGAGVVGGPDENFTRGWKLIERAGVGGLKRDAGAGVGDGLAENERRAADEVAGVGQNQNDRGEQDELGVAVPANLGAGDEPGDEESEAERESGQHFHAVAGVVPGVREPEREEDGTQP